jgi:hypothetical protein
VKSLGIYYMAQNMAPIGKTVGLCTGFCREKWSGGGRGHNGTILNKIYRHAATFIKGAQNCLFCRGKEELHLNDETGNMDDLLLKKLQQYALPPLPPWQDGLT